MKAGRELDRLIEKKVFDRHSIVCRGCGDERPLNYGTCQRCQCNSDLPHYSTSIAAAWEVARQAKIEYVPVYENEQETCVWICQEAIRRVENAPKLTELPMGMHLSGHPSDTVYFVEDDGTVLGMKGVRASASRLKVKGLKHRKAEK